MALNQGSSTRNLSEMWILGPTPDLLNKKFWSGAQQSVVEQGCQVMLIYTGVWEPMLRQVHVNKASESLSGTTRNLRKDYLERIETKRYFIEQHWWRTVKWGDLALHHYNAIELHPSFYRKARKQSQRWSRDWSSTSLYRSLCSKSLTQIQGFRWLL